MGHTLAVVSTLQVMESGKLLPSPHKLVRHQKWGLFREGQTATTFERTSAYSETSFTDDSLTETDVVHSNGSAMNSCTVSVDAHQIPLSNPARKHESEIDRVGELNHHSCNQLSHNNFRSVSSGHLLPSKDSTNKAACYGDSLRSEAELTCFY